MVKFKDHFFWFFLEILVCQRSRRPQRKTCIVERTFLKRFIFLFEQFNVTKAWFPFILCYLEIFYSKIPFKLFGSCEHEWHQAIYTGHFYRSARMASDWSFTGNVLPMISKTVPSKSNYKINTLPGANCSERWSGGPKLTDWWSFCVTLTRAESCMTQFARLWRHQLLDNKEITSFTFIVAHVLLSINGCSRVESSTLSSVVTSKGLVVFRLPQANSQLQVTFTYFAGALVLI